MKYIIGFLLVTLLYCSTKPFETKKNIERINSGWITYHDTIDAGFILTFKYPDNIELADVIDNCRCVGKKTKYYDKNESSEKANTNQWCICMQDTVDYSIDYLISSWKSLYNGQVVEQRETIMIDNLKALQITFKSNNKNTSYRKLIYLKKYSTLFEIINTYEATDKDFETFCKSIKIEEYNKPRK